MMRVHKVFASCFGIGLLKGGGTVAALAFCILWFFLFRDGHPENILPAVALLLTALGVWSGNKVEKDWGKDSSRVVIDEAAGMCISLLLVPVTLIHGIAALVLFRFFDILKPLYIRRAEALPGGWGVMMDDVIAGIYSNLVLHIAMLVIYFAHA